MSASHRWPFCYARRWPGKTFVIALAMVDSRVPDPCRELVVAADAAK
jgi:hypothetical protein